MSTRRRARTRDLLLVAGHVDDLTAMQHTLALLPAEAYGHVFVEASSAEEIVPVAAPARMTVTWLVGTAARGAALNAAVGGWAAEWLPAFGPQDGTSIAWIGATASLDIAFIDELRDLASEVHTLPELSQLEPRTGRA